MSVGFALVLLITFIGLLAMFGIGLFIKGVSLIGSDKDGYGLIIIGFMLMLMALVVEIVFWP